jgi:IS1 family transposase
MLLPYGLDADEFWNYVRKKNNRFWLIYTCHRDSGETVAFVWGKRDLKTAKRVEEKIVGFRRKLRKYCR